MCKGEIEKELGYKLEIKTCRVIPTTGFTLAKVCDLENSNATVAIDIDSDQIIGVSGQPTQTEARILKKLMEKRIPASDIFGGKALEI